MRRTLIFSVLDQAALSAFNFLLALMLIKYWSDKPEVFGVYAVVLAGSLTLSSVQNALVIGHLTVLRPKARGEEDEAALLSMFWSVNAVVTVGAMAASFLGTKGVLGGSDEGLGLAVALYIGAALVREYTRSYDFSSLRFGSALTHDLLSIALSAVAIAYLWRHRPPLSLNVLFLSLAAGQALASALAILPHRRHFRFSFGRQARGAYLTVWREQSSWALLSVIATEFQQRGYVFVVAHVFGTAHVALLQAAALMFRPVQLLTHAWGKFARVILADHFAHGRYVAARSFTLKSLAALAGIFFCFLAVLALAWPLIELHIFQAEFSNLEIIVALWSVAAGLTITAGVFSVEAQSRIRFRELCYASILGAFGCAVVLCLAVAIGDFRGSILAAIAGQLVFLFMLYRILAASDRAIAKAQGAKSVQAEAAATMPANVLVPSAAGEGHVG